jgi:hypothetical protein
LLTEKGAVCPKPNHHEGETNMNDTLAHATNPRPSKSNDAIPETDEAPIRATLVDALHAEVARARAFLPAEPDKAADALDVIADLVSSIDTKLSNIVAMTREAEEYLAPAALAFAVVDRQASELHRGGKLRESFNHSIGMAVEDLHAILLEAGDIANDDEPTATDAAAEE